MTVLAASATTARPAGGQSPPAEVAIIAPPSAGALVSQLTLELGIVGVAVTDAASSRIAAFVIIDEAGQEARVEAQDPAAGRLVRPSVRLDPAVPTRTLALQIVEEVRRALRQPTETRPEAVTVIASPPDAPIAERAALYVGGGAGSGALGARGRAVVELAFRPRPRWILSTEVLLAWPTETVDAPEGSAHLRGGSAALGLRRARPVGIPALHVEGGVGAGVLAMRIDGSPAGGYVGTTEWAFAARAFLKGVVCLDLGRTWRLTAAAEVGGALPAVRIRFAGRDVSERSPMEAGATLGVGAVFR
jgi:hypothetical protein